MTTSIRDLCGRDRVVGGNGGESKGTNRVLDAPDLGRFGVEGGVLEIRFLLTRRIIGDEGGLDGVEDRRDRRFMARELRSVDGEPTFFLDLEERRIICFGDRHLVEVGIDRRGDGEGVKSGRLRGFGGAGVLYLGNTTRRRGGEDGIEGGLGARFGLIGSG